MNIFVANLNFKIKTEKLQEIFEEYGEVTSVRIITDKESGRSKGYGFVEMPDENQGNIAIEELDGVELEGRQIVVKKARPKKEF